MATPISPWAIWGEALGPLVRALAEFYVEHDEFLTRLQADLSRCHPMPLPIDGRAYHHRRRARTRRNR